MTRSAGRGASRFPKLGPATGVKEGETCASRNSVNYLPACKQGKNVTEQSLEEKPSPPPATVAHDHHESEDESWRRDRLLSSLHLLVAVALFLSIPFALKEGASSSEEGSVGKAGVSTVCPWGWSYY